MPKVLRRAYTSDRFANVLEWDRSLADSRTWLHDGEEVLVAARFEVLKRAGLNAGAQRARPEHQKRKQREGRALYFIPAWKVGLYLAFMRFRRDGAPGPWWTGGNSWVLAKLTAVERGKKRVRAAAAAVAFLALLDVDHPAPHEALTPLLRRAGAFFDEDIAGG